MMDRESMDEQLARVAAALPDAAPTTVASIERRARVRRRRRIATRAGGVAAVIAVTVVAVPGLFDYSEPTGVEIVGGPSGLVPAESGWPQVRGSTLVFGLDEIEQGTTSGVIEDRQVFFVRTGDEVDVFVAAAQHLPDEGLWWCPDEQVFASPLHGELFDRAGRVRRGPAARDLDRFATDVRDGHLHVDAGEVILGAPVQPGEHGDARARAQDEDVLSTDAERGYDQPWSEGFCTDHEPDTDPPRVLATDVTAARAPATARPTDATQVPRRVRELFVLDDTTTVIAVPVPATPDRHVFATPDTEPPIMFATACDLLAAVPLPVGWLGYCLELTDQGPLRPVPLRDHLDRPSSARSASPRLRSASAAYLDDGTPVFVTRTEDATVHVVDALDPHLDGKLVVHCPTIGRLLEPRAGSTYLLDGTYAGGPSPSDLTSYATEITDDGDVRHRHRARPPQRRSQRRTDRFRRSSVLRRRGSPARHLPTGPRPAHRDPRGRPLALGLRPPRTGRRPAGPLPRPAWLRRRRRPATWPCHDALSRQLTVVGAATPRHRCERRRRGAPGHPPHPHPRRTARERHRGGDLEHRLAPPTPRATSPGATSTSSGTDERLLLRFDPDGWFSADTPCGNRFGRYRLEDATTITFSDVTTTATSCPYRPLEDVLADVFDRGADRTLTLDGDELRIDTRSGTSLLYTWDP